MTPEQRGTLHALAIRYAECEATHRHYMRELATAEAAVQRAKESLCQVADDNGEIYAAIRAALPTDRSMLGALAEILQVQACDTPGCSGDPCCKTDHPR